ncbi:MAG: hypothetical protein ICV79_23820 [Flavisolibacter sp.]|nr:hypothetical protein [Flavisolibacter sp.]
MKIILFVMMFSITYSSFCQQTVPSKPSTREEYLAKSKRQKSGAKVLLIGGVALLTTSIVIGTTGDPTFETLGTLAVVGTIGAAAALGSIPLFIASEKNYRRARAATTYFKLEKAPVLQPAGISLRSYPSVAVKANF